MSGRIDPISPPAAGPWLAGRFLDLLYPERCVNCGRFGATLCKRCEALLEPATGSGRCPNCASRWDQPDNCPRCFGWASLDGVRAAFEMDGAARKIVHALKYRGVRSLAGRMAGAMEPLRESTPFDVALPVPLHRSRERHRGFNQAELILEELGWACAEGRLRRIRNTPHQVGRHQAERRSNVAGAFAYEGPSLAGLTVAVVDDVVTTGATVSECARVLRDHGARRIFAIAYARASFDPRSRQAIDD